MVEELAERIGVKGGSMVLIKDCVACKGGFMLHYLLTKLLTDTNARVVMLGLSEPFSHYARIARKQGCNLQTMRDSGRFGFVDQQQVLNPEGSPDPGANLTSNSENPLSGLYLKVREAAKVKASDIHNEIGEQTCIMVDDASILDVIAGGSQNFVLDFLHYCRALKCGQQRCSVILLTHQDVYEEPPDSYMNLELEYAADTILTVEPLTTGLAADVHGQVTRFRNRSLFVPTIRQFDQYLHEIRFLNANLVICGSSRYSTERGNCRISILMGERDLGFRSISLESWRVPFNFSCQGNYENVRQHFLVVSNDMCRYCTNFQVRRFFHRIATS